jgi:hypothetical protein
MTLAVLVVLVVLAGIGQVIQFRVAGPLLFLHLLQPLQPLIR